MNRSFFGAFKHIRSCLDYQYHDHYSEERQLFQDQIVLQILNGYKRNPNRQSPLLFYTAGAMGAGKSHSLRFLAESLKIELDKAVWIDPDKIKELLPEFAEYKKTNPEQAGTLVHKESGFICEIILEVALERELDIINDGSMVDYLWFQREFARIRKMYPNYQQIEIMYVQAPWSQVLARVTARGEQTGRIIDPTRLKEVYDQVPRSIEILQNCKFVDRVYYVDNGENEVPSITNIYNSKS